MDFSVIRPKVPPPKKPDALPPAPAPPPPPPSEKLPPPPPPRPRPHLPSGPYMEELDSYSRMQRVTSVEYTNARTWRMNFGNNYPNDYNYDNYTSNYHQNSYNPFGGHSFHQDHYHPPPQMLLPPPNYHHALPGPPPRLALPPPHYNYGPPRDPYYYPQPYYGGYFSPENPNNCSTM